MNRTTMKSVDNMSIKCILIQLISPISYFISNFKDGTQFMFKYDYIPMSYYFLRNTEYIMIMITFIVSITKSYMLLMLKYV